MVRLAAALCLGVLGGACVIVSDDEPPCSSADNTCQDPWFLSYCAEGEMWGSDCYDACTSNPTVYASTCGGDPAVTGECSASEGLCVCWCDDAFDSCVEGTDRVHYTRAGQSFEIDCKDYCGGTCDASLGACRCT